MVLFLTKFSPDDSGGGAFIARHLVQTLSPEQVHWFYMAPLRNKVPFHATHVSFEAKAPPNYANVRLKLEGFWRWFYRRIWGVYVARTLAARIRQDKPRVLWVIADYSVAPVLLRLLPKIEGVRVHLSIHDSLVSCAERNGQSQAFIREITTLIDRLKKISFTADGVSEEILEEIVPTARRTAIITLPVKNGSLAVELSPPRQTGPLKIGYSGNFLGLEEFKCFAEGLNLWSAKSGRDWEMDAFGADYLGRLDRRINAHGFIRPEDVQRGLWNCDLFLLPSPLERPEMLTNLPTKLVTYLECGKLIFCFAPGKSATERVIREAHVGFVCTRLNPNLVVTGLEQLLSWDMNRACHGRHNLMTHRFDGSRIMRSFKQALEWKP